jgi:hypothetical protein
MYSLNGRLVLLENTVLIFILHILEQDLMKSGGVDCIEKLLEPALFWRKAWSSILRFVVQGCSDNPDGEEAE